MATATKPGAAGGAGAGAAPRQAGLVLLALIVVAAVANLNLTVANVALPDIGRAFDTGQTTLDLIAIGYSLGLAGSVLYLGAVGDRYGRRMMLVLGVLVSIPACLMAAYAPGAGVLLAGRLLGGISAGMAYPTTLALITALWSGPARIRAIALWSGIGGAIMQSILGALLTAGYARAIAGSVASSPDRSRITGSVQSQLEKSFTGAQEVAQRYPQYAAKITAAAKSAFLAGDQWAYAAAILGVLLGAALVFALFPRKAEEAALLARYHAEDSR